MTFFKIYYTTQKWIEYIYYSINSNAEVLKRDYQKRFIQKQLVHTSESQYE